MSDGFAKPVIFISYARKDEPDKPKRGEVQWRTFVQSYLAPAGLNGIVHIWVDEGIRGGDKWKKEIEAQLESCDLFILLVSVNSLASEVVVNFEIKTIQERQATGEKVHIFPIVLEPFPKKAVPWLMELNLRPKAGKPLSEFSVRVRKSEMAAIADEVVEIIAQIMAGKKELAQPIAPVKEPKTIQGIIESATGSIVIDIAQLPETAYERLVGREIELSRLDDAWSDRNANILSLIAEGGAGKSALVNEWLKGMRADNYRGAETVLGWSFYSQGTKERATSAEQFLNWGIEKLGIKLDTSSATAKGEAIAEELMKRRVLLVLDGCEPLQHGLDKQQGELKDQGLRALLRRFASTPPGQTHGLVVLTSRLAIKDVARWQDSSAPVKRVDKLSDDAGAALLRDNGAWGTDKELQAAVRDFGGHPLALGLLASYLRETQNGDVRRRDHIRQFFADTENPRHDHARRVMESYEKEWLVGQPTLRAILYLIGLFDRPASGDCLRALRLEPVIPGLTDPLANLDEREWQRAVARLREVRLLAPLDPSAPDALDAHPLVREWFGERLKQIDEAAWKAAHTRLYEHLRDTTNEGKAPTLEDLAPLYQAIAHSCRAGRYREALEKIYVARICRLHQAGGIEFYSTSKLGAFGSDLAAISWFFERMYSSPIDALTAAGQAWILNQAAHGLQTQGRFAEALPAVRASLRMDEEAGNWLNAAISASNLSQLENLDGQISAAVRTAEQSVLYADRSGDDFQAMGNRITYAATQHAAGRIKKAEELFALAEQRQRARQPNFPILYSHQGYLYCDLVLARGNYALAKDRASKTIEWAERAGFLLDIALDALTLGRACLGLALGPQHEADRTLSETRDAGIQLDKAIDGLRAAGHGDQIPLGFLARAALCRSAGNWESAARDLEEVEEIAESGPMRLHLCNMALERARLAFAKIEAFAPLNGLINDSPPKPVTPDATEGASLKEEAAKQLAIAADYIKACGYHRRDEELAELQAVLRGERKFADLPPRV